MLLEGKVAMVSGVGPGLGRSIALALAREGANVALAARSEGELRSVAAEIGSLRRTAMWRRTDVGNDDDCKRFASQVVSDLGGIDIVVNSAARGNTGIRFEDGRLETWRDAMEICFFGALRFTYAALPSMIERGGGGVINIGTMATRDVRPRQGAYAAAKTALLTSTKTLARELGPRGIRVNAVNPGYIAGENIQTLFKQRAAQVGGTAADQQRLVTEQIAIGRIPTADEIAGSVVFLASDLARPVTGHVIECNGGMWM